MKILFLSNFFEDNNHSLGAINGTCNYFVLEILLCGQVIGDFGFVCKYVKLHCRHFWNIIWIVPILSDHSRK